MSKIIIAIDGHSSCGKSTMAKALAQQVGYIYVDSGAMYRAVTLFALREQLFNADGSVQAEALQARMPDVKVHFKLDPDTHLPVTYLNEERVEDEIRTLEVSYEDILKNVQERDYIDSHREVSPLRQAEDALVLDNSHLTREEQNQWLLQQFDTAVRNAQ